MTEVESSVTVGVRVAPVPANIMTVGAKNILVHGRVVEVGEIGRMAAGVLIRYPWTCITPTGMRGFLRETQKYVPGSPTLDKATRDLAERVNETAGAELIAVTRRGEAWQDLAEFELRPGNSAKRPGRSYLYERFVVGSAVLHRPMLRFLSKDPPFPFMIIGDTEAILHGKHHVLTNEELFVINTLLLRRNQPSTLGQIRAFREPAISRFTESFFSRFVNNLKRRLDVSDRPSLVASIPSYVGRLLMINAAAEVEDMRDNPAAVERALRSVPAARKRYRSSAPQRLDPQKPVELGMSTWREVCGNTLMIRRYNQVVRSAKGLDGYSPQDVEVSIATATGLLAATVQNALFVGRAMQALQLPLGPGELANISSLEQHALAVKAMLERGLWHSYQAYGDSPRERKRMLTIMGLFFGLSPEGKMFAQEAMQRLLLPDGRVTTYRGLYEYTAQIKGGRELAHLGELYDLGSKVYVFYRQTIAMVREHVEQSIIDYHRRVALSGRR